MDHSQRKAYIDITKGIGILLVLVGHAITQANVLVPWESTFFMPMFFICSGLCYSKPKKIGSHAGTLLIPYYIWGGIGLVIQICLLLMRGRADLETLVQGVAGILMGTRMWNYPLWFLVAFFICKCVFDGIITVSQERKSETLIQCLAALVCYLVGLSMAYFRRKYHFIYPFRLDVGLTMVPFVLIGYDSRELADELEETGIVKRLLLVCALLAVNLVSLQMNTPIQVDNSNYGNPVIFLVGAVSGSYFVIFLSQFLCKIPTLEKPLSWLGRNSLTIMCSHAIVLVIVAKLLLIVNRFVGLSAETVDLAKFVCCTAAMVPLCSRLYTEKRNLLNSANGM